MRFSTENRTECLKMNFSFQVHEAITEVHADSLDQYNNAASRATRYIHATLE